MELAHNISDQHGKHEFLAQINYSRSVAFLVYLVDIFERINTLNLSLQGKEMYIFDLSDKLKAFQMKLQSWRRKTESGNKCMFKLYMLL